MKKLIFRVVSHYFSTNLPCSPDVSGPRRELNGIHPLVQLEENGSG